MSADSTVFVQPIANVHKEYRVIDQNLAFILQELPTLFLPDDLRNEITAVCYDFQSALYDVLAEIRILEDKLGLHPGEEPSDPGVVNPAPA